MYYHKFTILKNTKENTQHTQYSNQDILIDKFIMNYTQ